VGATLNLAISNADVAAPAFRHEVAEFGVTRARPFAAALEEASVAVQQSDLSLRLNFRALAVEESQSMNLIHRKRKEAVLVHVQPRAENIDSALLSLGVRRPIAASDIGAMNSHAKP
jgi:hypothetical protein